MRVIKSIILWVLFPLIGTIYIIYDECIKGNANIVKKALKTVLYTTLLPALLITGIIVQIDDTIKWLKSILNRKARLIKE